MPLPPRPDATKKDASEQPRTAGTYFLGRYRVVDEIGGGGMASVHLARMDGPGGFQKWVAIKRIHPHLVEDETFVNMFLDEARVAAQISHPNVAAVLELGRHEDTYWIAMEYLHGEPLREVMRRTEETGRPMAPEIACRVCADAAEGLHAAHELSGKNGEKMGVVHRDVTPHNLFVTYDGNTKIVDFGIAKFSSRTAHTRTGTVKGKLAYMSPEQVAGETIDRRTDVFALGVVLWELTTGQRLFRMDNDVDTLAKVRECKIPRPSAIVRGYPIDLEKIVMKMLARDKNERYRTARELSRALQSLLMRRGLFIAGDEVAAYMTSVFGERIMKREAHLRWAAEVTQTIDVDAGATDVPARAEAEEPSIVSYSSDVQPSQPPTARAIPRHVAVHLKPPPAAGPGAEANVPEPALPARAPAPPDVDPDADDAPTLAARRPPLDAPLDNEADDVNDTLVSPMQDMIDGGSTGALNDAASLFRAKSPPPAAGAPAHGATKSPAATPVSMVFGPRSVPPSQPMPPILPAVLVPAAVPSEPPGAHPIYEGHVAMVPVPASWSAPPAATIAPVRFDTQQTPRRPPSVPVWVVAVGSAVLGLAAFVLVVFVVTRGNALRRPAAARNGASTPAASPAVLVPFASAAAAPPDTTGAAPTPTPTSSAASTTTDAVPSSARSPQRGTWSAAPSGTLRVVCSPACSQVVDNGTPLGPSPVTRRGTTIGSHRLNLVWPDGAKVVSTVVIADRTATVRETHP